MALPVIIVDSASGSDSAASGAGPGDGTTSGSALTGTSASYSSTTVTLDGSPDLSNVDTTGLHVLYLVTSTGRRFFRITAKDNTAKTVTVHTAPSGTTSGLSWAIGGKRASALSSSSWLIFGTPDAEAGWIVRMLSGHSETSAGGLLAGNSEAILEGIAGAATMPLITFTNAATGIDCGVGVTFRAFEVRNNNATKTSNAFRAYYGTGGFNLDRIVCTHATHYFQCFAYCDRGIMITRCHIANQTVGIALDNAGNGSVYNLVMGCYIHDNSSHGITCGGNGAYGGSADIINNIVVNNGGSGIRMTSYGTSIVFGNTVAGNTSDGIYKTMSGPLINNLVANNGGYGINSTASPSIKVAGNATYGNTSGAYNPSSLADPDDPNVDPNFVGSGDYTPQAAGLEGIAYPASIP